MQPCKKAEQSLKDTGKAIVIASIVWGWLTNDTRISSMSNTAIQTGKYMLKNDKKTRQDAITFVDCKIRKLLNEIF